MPNKPIALVEKLGSKEEKILQSIIVPGEQVIVAMKGQWNQTLVATNQRVIIIKAGWAAGATFGNKSVSFDLTNITAVEVRVGLVNGFVEVSAGGMQGYERSNWGKGQQSAYEAPNTVPISKAEQQKFQAAVQVIRQLVQEARKPAVQQVVMPAPAQPTGPSIPEQIQQLASLHQAGILTDAEFDKKKADLLARM